MFGFDYLAEVYRLLRSNHPWARAHLWNLFPMRPAVVYRAMARSGFSGKAYLDSSPDLQAALVGEHAAAMHFVEFTEHETKVPRRFAIALDFAELRALAARRVRDPFKLAGIVRCLLQAQIDSRPQCLSSSQFWRDVTAACAPLGTPCVVFGDSHSLIFRQTVRAEGGLVLPLQVLCGGGSATGLPNPTSRSGYGATIEAACRAIAAAGAIPVCLAFGQVDIEFVHTYRRLKSQARAFDQADFDAFCADVTGRYAAWVAALATDRVAVLGVNPPCVDDEHLLEIYRVQMQVYVGGGIADVREGETAELLVHALPHLELPRQARRTANHALFNRDLRLACEARHLPYFDSLAELLGADGLIRRDATCASLDGVMQVGLVGRDIHVAGPVARATKAALVARAIRATVGTRSPSA